MDIVSNYTKLNTFSSIDYDDEFDVPVAPGEPLPPTLVFRGWELQGE